VLLAVILLIAAALHVWAPWGDVFPSTAGDRVNFLETDAWYHLRLVENQVLRCSPPCQLARQPRCTAGQHVMTAGAGLDPNPVDIFLSDPQILSGIGVILAV